MASNSYTPTQQAILNVLSDGRIHSREELCKCLGDELSPVTALYFHVSSVRSKLQSSGQGIAHFHRNKVSYYQLVRILASPYQ